MTLLTATTCAQVGVLVGRLFGAIVVLVCHAGVFAQGSGVSLPASCTPAATFTYTAFTPSVVYHCIGGNQWALAPSGGVPTGAIVPFVSACPSGYTEHTALNGKMPLGTLAANLNVGTTGGADAITPVGTNSGTAVTAHAGAAVADHASHTHTYTDVIAHTHTQASQTATTGAVSSWEHGAIDTSSAASETLATGSTGVATGTTAGPSAALTHAVTQPANHGVTQPTFTGTAFDNRSAFVRVLFCEKS